MNTARMILALAAALAAGSVVAGDKAAARPDYTAHEWGTFTSIQGSDGKPIRWDPLAQSDLPDFVHGRRNPSSAPEFDKYRTFFGMLDGKGAQAWLQRMETPVIYFHAAKPLDVSLTVDFPSGLITEWYPAALAFGPAPEIPGLIPRMTNSRVEWAGLSILAESPAPAASDRALPHGDAPSHYYAARNVTANPVRTTIGAACTKAGLGETERYVFYRGVANFTAPLVVRANASLLLVQNTGTEPIRAAFAWHARGTEASLVALGTLAPGSTKSVNVAATKFRGERRKLAGQFRDTLAATLAKAGLNRDEADAMVATWKDSWFDEDGTRILYLVPRSFVDATLPVKLDPAPTRFERVFVGRAEVIESALEQKGDALFAEFRRNHDATIATSLRGSIAPRFVPAFLYQVAQRRVDSIPGFGLSVEFDTEGRRAETMAIWKDIETLRSAMQAPGSPRETVAVDNATKASLTSGTR